MPVVRRLKTQTEAFWRDEFEVTPEDLNVASGAILEAGEPQSLTSLASAVMIRRLGKERESVAHKVTSGEIYQPKMTYEVGQTLVFSALDYASGQVTSIRDGKNPKYGEFQVIRVAFQDCGEREYACALDVPHPLNRPVEELLGDGDPNLNDTDVVDAYDAYVASALAPLLESDSDYVQFGDRWFLKELLPEIDVGHLNLAEAALYLASHPMTAREIFSELALDVAGSEEALLFAMNRALTEDERFDNVGHAAEPLWYLYALEPEAIKNPPVILENGIRATGGEYIGLTLLEMVESIGDELDDIQSTPSEAQDSFDFEVTFPYLYAGALPARSGLLRALPEASGQYYPIEMLDEESDKRFQAWVVPERRYICGLDDWYRTMNVGVGARIRVRRTDHPTTLAISANRVRGTRKQWVRTALVADGKFRLEMRQPPQQMQAVEVDSDMLLDVPEPDAVAKHMAREENRTLSVGALVRAAFHYLAGLTGTGYAHAKSIYAVANMIRRTGAVPVFSELTAQACFDPMGQGMWAYDHALDGRVYHTPDEMLNRPLSTRDNVVKDQAVPYTGR